jgi:hypothetical protein
MIQTDHGPQVDDGFAKLDRCIESLEELRAELNPIHQDRLDDIIRLLNELFPDDEEVVQ